MSRGPGIVNGVIGPRGDGYVVDQKMSSGEAALYHAGQIRSFKTEIANSQSSEPRSSAAR